MQFDSSPAAIVPPQVQPISGAYFNGLCYPSPSWQTQAQSADDLAAFPLWIFRRRTFDQVLCEVTSGSVGTIRLGIYHDDGTGSKPGALLSDLGTVDSNLAAVKTLSISLTLDPGFYWRAIGFSSTPTMQCFATTIDRAIPHDNFTIQNPARRIENIDPWTFGALPDPFATTYDFVTAAMPAVQFREA